MTDFSSEQNLKARAMKSGPRSAQGKLRVSRNSTIHGLSVSLRLTKEEEVKASVLARIICNGNERPDVIAAAKRLAYAQFELERVRKAILKYSFIPKDPSPRHTGGMTRFKTEKNYAEAILSVDFATLEKSEHKAMFGYRLPNKLVKTMIRYQHKHEVVRTESLNRYEKRTRSAIRTAMRSLDNLLLEQ